MAGLANGFSLRGLLAFVYHNSSIRGAGESSGKVNCGMIPN